MITALLEWLQPDRPRGRHRAGRNHTPYPQSVPPPPLSHRPTPDNPPNVDTGALPIVASVRIPGYIEGSPQ